MNVANTKVQSTTTRRTKACILYSNSNLSGVRYQYKANTTVTILQHVNSYVDKVRVNATGSCLLYTSEKDKLEKYKDMLAKVEERLK